MVIRDERGPQQVVEIDNGGKLTRPQDLAACKAIFDEQGRFAPSYDPADDDQFHAGDTVIEAIGQIDRCQRCSAMR
ncbi:MAG: hypothetical protein V9E86_10465 [Nitrosomonas sp.]